MKKLKLFATLRDLAGTKEISVPFADGQTVRQLVQDIRDACPELGDYMVDEHGELNGLVHILVHGRHVQWLDGMDTTIKETDIVTLIPPTAGG